MKFKYPRIYWQKAWSGGCPLDHSRLRIIYPNGRCYWFEHGHDEWFKSCFARDKGVWMFRNKPELTLKAMRRFDRDVRFDKAEFIGEIR